MRRARWARPVMPRRCQAHISAVRVFHLRPSAEWLRPVRPVRTVLCTSGWNERVSAAKPRRRISFDPIVARRLRNRSERDIFYCPTIVRCIIDRRVTLRGWWIRRIYIYIYIPTPLSSRMLNAIFIGGQERSLLCFFFFNVNRFNVTFEL